MDELRKQKRENLVKIDAWCKEFMGDSKLYLKLKHTIFCNRRNYSIHVSANGIVAIGDGKFSPFLRATEGSNSLFDCRIGTEIVLQWQQIKAEIIRERERVEAENKAIMEFVV